MTTENASLINANAVRKSLGGVSQMTIRRWLERGILPPPVYINRLRYWRRADIEAIAAKGAQPKRGDA